MEDFQYNDSDYELSDYGIEDSDYDKEDSEEMENNIDYERLKNRFMASYPENKIWIKHIFKCKTSYTKLLILSVFKRGRWSQIFRLRRGIKTTLGNFIIIWGGHGISFWF